jgi:hypothetical protein
MFVAAIASGLVHAIALGADATSCFGVIGSWVTIAGFVFTILAVTSIQEEIEKALKVEKKKGLQSLLLDTVLTIDDYQRDYNLMTPKQHRTWLRLLTKQLTEINTLIEVIEATSNMKEVKAGRSLQEAYEQTLYVFEEGIQPNSNLKDEDALKKIMSACTTFRQLLLNYHTTLKHAIQAN